MYAFIPICMMHPTERANTQKTGFLDSGRGCSHEEAVIALFFPSLPSSGCSEQVETHLPLVVHKENVMQDKVNPLRMRMVNNICHTELNV